MNAQHIQRLAYRLGCYDFPWDVTRSLELALFRSFASPRIGGLLHATGEFEARPQKRYDDTDLIVSEIIENGFESERGQRAIARMNAIHSRFGWATVESRAKPTAAKCGQRCHQHISHG